MNAVSTALPEIDEQLGGEASERAYDSSGRQFSVAAPSRARIRLAFSRRSDKLTSVTETEINWPEALRRTGGGNAVAVSALREYLLNGLRLALRDRTEVSEAQLEDFTQEALLRILDCLDQFQGRS